MIARCLSKRTTAFAVAALAVAAMVPDAARGQEVIRIANFYAASHPMNVALNDVFVPLVEAYTDGAYTVQVFPESQLGAERELTEGVRLGSIEMGVTGGVLSATYPKIGALELPFMFDSFDDVWRVLDGPVGAELEADFADAGLKVLAWIGNGFRVISNNVRPIHTLADTEGILLRMPENDVYVSTGEALGFSVVTMPFSEVLSAMQQGVINGQDNPFATLWASQFYTAQDHVAVSYHIFSHGQISMNLDLWNSLSADAQQAFQRAATVTAVYQRHLLEVQEQELIEQVEAAGLEITYPDIAAFREATESVRLAYAERHPETADLITAVLVESAN